jgi:hypothetical protein
MTSMKREDLRALRDARPPCVSLYMPTLRPAVEIPQNRIRLKNLLRQAEEQLAERAELGDEILAPGREMLADNSFWQQPMDGLAVFLAPGLAHHFRVTEPFRELAMVGDRFHLAPLLPLLSGNGHYHLLALSQKDVRLYAGDRDALHEVSLRGVPRNVQAALHYDVTEHSLQFHSTPATPQTIGSRGRPSAAGQAVPVGRRQGMFHGHGVVDDDTKEQVQRFFEVLAERLEKVWHRHQPPLPLLLAGVDYERAMFRAASKHPRILESGIEGNTEYISTDELLERARPIVEPLLHEEAGQKAAAFQNLAGTPRASTDLEEVLLAAADGRVDTLFCDTTVQRWGRFDPATRSLEVHGKREPGDEELVDRAVHETVFHGGLAYPASGDSGLIAMGPVAAVFRY